MRTVRFVVQFDMGGAPLRIMVTGGAGFIGATLVRHIVSQSGCQVLNFDKLTYASGLESLSTVVPSQRYSFVQGDINDAAAVARTIVDFRPQVIAHLAAETHVDRSIDAPGVFVKTNIVGTFTLLEQALGYFRSLNGREQAQFRFHHISTDEVYGSLGADGLFTEQSRYDPRSPYSASKAGSDHLVRAWGHSFGLPVLITNCSNNYGPYQFPEKLIPLMIIRALAGHSLPVYGDGSQIRDWLHVDDHAAALRRVIDGGIPGETYNIGGNAERRNIDVVRQICAVLDREQPCDNGRPYAEQISFVADRPGHDQRYAIDASKIERELGWRPQHDFASGIEETVRWYLDNRGWWQAILDRRYATERLGRGSAS